ncbi:hypothetical protein GCM10017687_42340 [Streptomyces echinatus]
MSLRVRGGELGGRLDSMFTKGVTGARPKCAVHFSALEPGPTGEIRRPYPGRNADGMPGSGPLKLAGTSPDSYSVMIGCMTIQGGKSLATQADERTMLEGVATTTQPPRPRPMEVRKGPDRKDSPLAGTHPSVAHHEIRA